MRAPLSNLRGREPDLILWVAWKVSPCVKYFRLFFQSIKGSSRGLKGSVTLEVSDFPGPGFFIPGYIAGCRARSGYSAIIIFCAGVGGAARPGPGFLSPGYCCGGWSAERAR